MACFTSESVHGTLRSRALALAFACAIPACRQVAGLEDVRVDSTSAAGAGTSATGSGGGGGAPCDQDPGSDSHNCGACGHDCRGGECTAGVCQPLVIAKNQYIPHQIAVDPGVDGDVFWTDYVSVVKASKMGGGEFPLHYVGIELGSPRGIAVQGDTVVFTVFLDFQFQPAFVGSVDRTGENYRELTNGWVGPWFVATDSTAAYFTTRYDAHVVRVALDGNEAAEELDPGPDGGAHVDHQAWDVAVDATGVYYSADGSAWKVLPNGGQPTKISGSDEGVGFIAIDETHVYWFAAAPGNKAALRRFSKNDKGPVDTMLVTTVDGDLAIDETHVYWGDWSTSAGAIHRWKKDDQSGYDEIVATGYAGIGGVAVDATSVYWCAEWDSEILKLAK